VDCQNSGPRNSGLKLNSPQQCCLHCHHTADYYNYFVSDIAIFVLKRDVKLQLTNYYNYYYDCQLSGYDYHLKWHYDH